MEMGNVFDKCVGKSEKLIVGGILANELDELQPLKARIGRCMSEIKKSYQFFTRKKLWMHATELSIR